MPDAPSRVALPWRTRLGLLALGGILGAVGVDRLYRPEAPERVVAPARAAMVAGREAAADCEPAAPRRPPPAPVDRDRDQEGELAPCPPAPLPVGFATLDTPWGEIGVTDPRHAIVSLGNDGRSVIKGLNATFHTPATREALEECRSSLRPPPGSTIDRFECDLIFDLEAANGELRLLGGAMGDMTFSDNQIGDCLLDIYRQHDVIDVSEAGKPEKDYRLRLSWPVRLGITQD